MPSVSFLVLFLLSLSPQHLLLHSAAEDEGEPPPTLSCRSMGCKEQHWVPFALDESKPGCEFFGEVYCDHEPPLISLGGGEWYRLKNSSRAGTIVIQDEDLKKDLEQGTCRNIDNFYLPDPDGSAAPVSIKPAASRTELITLYKCPRNLSIDHPPARYTYHRCSDFIIYYDLKNRTSASPPDGCSIIGDYPINKSTDLRYLVPLLTSDITLEVHISTQCLRCPLNGSHNCQDKLHHQEFQCAHADLSAEDIGSQPQPQPTYKSKNYGAKNLGLELGLGNQKLRNLELGLGPLVGFLLVIVFFFLWWRHRSIKQSKDHPSIEAFLKSHGSLAPKRYSNSDIKKMTNSFKDKIGGGGYGVVYKGNLPDDRRREVAVKVLNETKGDGEEFTNEVASISKTSHVNIVSLLGFCFDGSKRALVYEFMPKGSLDKYLCNENPSKIKHMLGWGTLYNIAVGIARGLEYLHRGCNTRILHFDIKPHNILLSDDFCPKISDFGLAELCTRKDSVISMLGTRGTPGYIAPEVFSRAFGGVSHKSDVYSFGMVVLDMVGARKDVDGGSSGHSTDEVYFPDSIYRSIQEEDHGPLEISNDERDCARKMKIVSLWCIQTKPSDRPSMRQALDMLEGSLDSLRIPPKPVLSSPPVSLLQYSTTATASGTSNV